MRVRIIDVSGPMYHGMWTYGPPYPDVVVEEIPQPEFIEYPTYSWRFELGAQSGTYLETSLHLFPDGPPLVEVPVEDLFMRDAAILRVPAQANQRLEIADLEACEVETNPGDAIIVATGWDSHWDEPDFVSDCPYFSYEAMRWVLDREPFLFAGDMPRFDSWEEPQGGRAATRAAGQARRSAQRPRQAGGAAAEDQRDLRGAVPGADHSGGAIGNGASAGNDPPSLKLRGTSLRGAVPGTDRGGRAIARGKRPGASFLAGWWV